MMFLRTAPTEQSSQRSRSTLRAINSLRVRRLVDSGASPPIAAAPFMSRYLGSPWSLLGSYFPYEVEILTSTRPQMIDNGLTIHSRASSI